MLRLDPERGLVAGPHGSLRVPADGGASVKLAMLIAGECLGLGPDDAAEAFGYTRQRYFQLKHAFAAGGAPALADRKPGPTPAPRGLDEAARQIVRHRFLDPEASPEVIAQRLAQSGLSVGARTVARVIAWFGLQKKLHDCRPGAAPPLEAFSGRKHTRRVGCDPTSIERGVRQALADKVSGSHLGTWLLAAEHLRLGTRGLLLDWAGRPACRVEPRLALQPVNEAAPCVAGTRANRSPPRAAFGLLDGLPFMAADPAIHDLLAARAVEQAIGLQLGLGLRRQALGHFAGRLLVVDPHRVRGASKRRMRHRRETASAEPCKLAQTFFALDADTRQPVCFTTGTASRTVTRATPGLLELAAGILPAREGKTLVLADAEHFSAALMRQVAEGGRFDLMAPTAMGPKELARLRGLPADTFTRRWAGYATAWMPYTPAKSGGGRTRCWCSDSGSGRGITSSTPSSAPGRGRGWRC